ncbi:uncharacterized protein DUF1961 [Flavobacterium sp. 1]|uniref:DUF1961 family protein n=1 Tax=Flavobacterium sp. 1 TaxID=2035200 RepID=UPI000CB78201|nr:DUF1961 family protein [Flavobacterium sp. 1]PJJ08473.1 uncharacterized protein DUF1961 [Flavobacterium sp. 1]
MDKNLLLILILFFSALMRGQNTDLAEFETLNQSKQWQLQFNDPCTKDWQSKWFLDGLHADIKNTKEGMLFSGGNVEGDDAYNAVLWTKDSFKGDVKIEYSYTKTDNKTIWATILYLQATGIGIAPYVEDISQWNNLREIPAMKTYYTNMKALHISYASYDNKNTDIKNDYIRVRKYPVLAGQNFNTTTEIPSASFETGLFNPNETYQITIIKNDKKLYFKVVGKNISKLFSWDLSNSPAILEGRIGLRHMHTRSARYKDFSVFTKR